MHAEPVKGEWRSWTWGEVWNVSFNFAKSLVALGASHRSAVNIIGYNSPFWIWAFYGTILADNIAVGVYTTNTPGACQYVADHSSAEVIMAENETQMYKYLDILHQLPKLKAIIVWSINRFPQKPNKIVYGWEEFLELGNKETGLPQSCEDIVLERIENQVPGKCCNIVYTSGTTGNPKGVMLTHDNQYFVYTQMLKNAEDEKVQLGKERIVSYLPLSHSAAQLNDILANLIGRFQIYFARPDALQDSLVGKFI